MPVINATNLDALRVGFSALFQQGQGQAAPQFERITTIVPASTREQRYGWIGKIPNVREWVGARAVQNLATHDYTIREKAWELTLAVERDDIETDNLGVYGPLFTEMGRAAAATWDRLCFGLLKDGFTTACYDGQNFFDTDHPVLDENGAAVSVSNTGGGSGPAWFLMDVSRALKPIILQRRRDFEFVSKTAVDDERVFMNREFVYGADARANAGFGFWQFAYGSRQPLTAANYATARAAILGMKGDYGRPLGLVPNLLVVPPALEGDARKLLNSDYAAGGESNPWRGTAELLVSPWLA